MLVVDASVVLDLLLARPGAEAARARVLDSREPLSAPHLLDVEVIQVLRRFAARGDVTAERGTMTVMLLRQMPVTRYAHQPLLPRIWRLRDNLSAYDAAYIALAEALGAPLVTRDTALANATGHRARVDIV